MDAINVTLQNFLTDFGEYLPPEIPVLRKPPIATEFLTEHVMANIPFILKPPRNEVPFQSAMVNWQDIHYLREMMGGYMVTVAATPDGRADAVSNDKFMLPEERIMTFDSFLNYYNHPNRLHVLYVQKQNNNLIEEFSPMLDEVSYDIPWATEAFGKPPDAANLWMGHHFSSSTLHKDNYENLYFVVTGVKTFKLYPPVAITWMPYKTFPMHQWYYEEKAWKERDLNQEIDWIVHDHKPENIEKFKLYERTRCYIIDVHPGEGLYIPAMWFHEVTQSDNCIAVNYWYDMGYEIKYPFFQMLNNFAKLTGLRKSVAIDTQEELEERLLTDLTGKVQRKRDKEAQLPNKFL